MLIALLLFFCSISYSSIPIEESIYDSHEKIPDDIRTDADLQIQVNTERNKQSYLLYNLLGIEFYKKKYYKKALREFEKAVELNDKFARGYNNLGLSYFMLGRLEEALDEFKKAIESKENYFEAYNNLGSVYLDLGNYSRAEDAFYKAKSFNQGSEEVNANLIQVRELKKKRIVNSLVLFASLSGLALFFIKKSWQKGSKKTKI